jgi:methionine-rich copper-binding protein CopC
MRTFALAAFAAATLAIIVGASPALAHASLTSCSIKNNQIFTQASAPKMIKAYFAEPLDPAKSWINVFEGQADHGLVNEKTRSVLAGPKELTLKLPRLQKEKYYMIWYTHSAADGHYASGIVYFTVK